MVAVPLAVCAVCWLLLPMCLLVAIAVAVETAATAAKD